MRGVGRGEREREESELDRGEGKTERGGVGGGKKRWNGRRTEGIGRR